MTLEQEASSRVLTTEDLRRDMDITVMRRGERGDKPLLNLTVGIPPHTAEVDGVDFCKGDRILSIYGIKHPVRASKLGLTGEKSHFYCVRTSN